MVYFTGLNGKLLSMNDLEKKNILILFGAESKLEWGRSYQLARAFHSNGHNVLYVDLPNPVSKCLSKKSSNQNINHETFDVYQPELGLPYGKISCLRPLNRIIIYTQLLNYLNRKRFIPTILWIYSPYEPKIAQALINRFEIKKIVYDCADDRVALADTESGQRGGKIVEKLEKELCSFCSCVISITENLKKIKGYLHPAIHVVPNGVDSRMFNDEKLLEKPEQFKSISGKIILYAGAVEEWIDQETMVKAAIRYPDFSFAFVGPVRTDVSGMKALPNIHFLGRQEYRAMPSYMAYSDLCIIPFKDNEVTRACDPLKSLQYLAMGRPVLSTWYGGINDYNGLVRVAGSSEDFVEKIGEIIRNNEGLDQEKLQNVVKSFSWEHLTGEALKLINGGLSR